MWVEVRKKWMVLMWVAERTRVSARVIQHMKRPKTAVKAKSYLSMVFAAVEIKNIKENIHIGD